MGKRRSRKGKGKDTLIVISDTIKVIEDGRVIYSGKSVLPVLKKFGWDNLNMYWEKE